MRKIVIEGNFKINIAVEYHVLISYMIDSLGLTNYFYHALHEKA